ncbi:MAG: DUF4340 domain-containing protein [Lachnospiraceae bacterium]|nr:DUF4340 domain-containing protein [Lachnospiraceae bacterium]
MMTRGKKLIALVLILALLGTSAGVVLANNARKEAAAAAGSSAELLNTSESGAEAITYTYEGETVSLKKNGEDWVYADDESFPLNGTMVAQMLDALSTVTATKTISKPGELSEYGLDKPSGTVTVTAGGTDTTFEFGGLTGISSEQYCNIGDGKVYLVDAAISQAFAHPLLSLVQCETIPNIYYIDDVTIETGSDATVIRMIEDSGLAYTDHYKYFMEDGDELKVLDNELTQAYLNNVRNLALTNCVNYKADDAALEEYGLADPDCVVTFNYLGNVKVENGTNEDGTTSYTYDQQQSVFTFYLSDDGYIRLNDSQMVYSIDPSAAEAMETTGYDDLRPDEPLKMDWDTVDSVTISFEGNDHEFTAEHTLSAEEEGDETASDSSKGTAKAETVTTWTCSGETKELGDFLKNITNLASAGYAYDLEPSDKDAVLSLKIFRSASENFPEVTAAFYPAEEGTYVTQINGEPTVYVNSADIDSLIESLKELMA